ncbi:tripartite tricarboxylate transporter substrate binding protein [Verticiella sediminum]|uniref:Tripartite tricarboxylate transporter substrate binding protein n=1 Tax=Verticiella sediminum TaxID=1247510 RepID=A0A556AIY4_9BURK|nr:tripartite tricarboxylate transporter substrate binding protein [Verticiella sediminum]TSH92825.1 tripartite tricarboxylate transporter substrate binding protein [Verticiella sediminum]
MRASSVVTAAQRHLQTRRALLAAIAALPFAGARAAAPYPTLKPISLVVPYPAGGASDASARILSGPIGESLGQQVIVENVAGGTGILGAMRVLNTGSDGYAMLHGSPNEVILSPLTNKAARYQPEDFRLTQPLSEVVLVLLTRQGLPPATLDEFIAYAREPRSKPLTYGSVGIGSLYHLVTEHLGQRVGADLLHVPYKGAAPVLQDLSGGQIDFAVLPFQTNMLGLVEQGRMNLLTSFSNTLPPPLAHLPKIGSSREVPDFEYTIGGGYFVPRDTPQEAVDKLRVAVGSAIARPDIRERMEAEGRLVKQPGSQQEADDYFAAEIAKYRNLVQAVGFEPT